MTEELTKGTSEYGCEGAKQKLWGRLTQQYWDRNILVNDTTMEEYRDAAINIEAIVETQAMRENARAEVHWFDCGFVWRHYAATGRTKEHYRAMFQTIEKGSVQSALQSQKRRPIQLASAHVTTLFANRQTHVLVNVRHVWAVQSRNYTTSSSHFGQRKALASVTIQSMRR